MKVFNRKRVTAAQQEYIKKCVRDTYNDLKYAHEVQIIQRYNLFAKLALADVAADYLKYGKDRKQRLINQFVEKMNELSNFCVSNKVEDSDGNINYDVDYNLDVISRKAKQHDIPFDEAIFEDIFE